MKIIDKQILASLDHAVLVGEGFLSFHILNPAIVDNDTPAFYEDFGCLDYRIIIGELGPHYFTFNEPIGACVTCLGLGTYHQVHPDLFVPDKGRSITDGVFCAKPLITT